MPRTQIYIKLIITIQLIVFCTPIERCDVHCNNFIKLNTTIEELSIKTSVSMAQVTIYPREIEIYILRRKLFRHVIRTGHTEANTVEKFDGAYLPEIDEASDWVLRNECKIGSVCVPGGDCYGDGLRHCDGMGLNSRWVKSANFRFKDTLMLLGGLFSKTSCIQDWECSIHKHKSVIYLNKNGVPFIKPGISPIFLNGSKYIIEADAGIWVDGAPKTTEIIQEVKCISSDLDKFCTVTSSGMNLWFRGNRTCVNSQNYRVCLLETKSTGIDDIDPSILITLDDFDSLKNEVSVLFKTQSVNNIILQNEVINLKIIVNKIITSISRYNPFVIKDILGMNVYSRKHGDYIKICPCVDFDNDCNLETIHQGDDSCKKVDSYKSIDIIRTDSLIDLVPIDIEVRGREETIYESEIEKTFSDKINYNGGSDRHNNGDWSSIIPGYQIFNNISSVLTYVNSFIILILLLRR